MSKNNKPLSLLEERSANKTRSAWWSWFAIHLFAGTATAIAVVTACWLTPLSINPMGLYELSPYYVWAPSVLQVGVVLVFVASSAADKALKHYVEYSQASPIYHDFLSPARSAVKKLFWRTAFWGVVASVGYVLYTAYLT